MRIRVGTAIHTTLTVIRTVIHIAIRTVIHIAIPMVHTATSTTMAEVPVPNPDSTAAPEFTTDLSLTRLLQLCSVSLPVGGYAFSQGMEYAIDAGWIRNAAGVRSWVDEQLTLSLAQTDVPILRMAMAAAEQQDWHELAALNELVLACRETHELRLTDTAMGEALHRLLISLKFDVPFERGEDISFICLFALAAGQWGISYRAAALGFLWSWLENQIAAATKLVPLGQTQAQQLLVELQPELPAALELADKVNKDSVGAGLPALAIASSRHEHMYSRLFRS